MTAPDIETLRAALHAYVDDSIDALIDDRYYEYDAGDDDDVMPISDDIERAQRFTNESVNLIHIMWAYENTVK